jgi:hypothetical protein
MNEVFHNIYKENVGDFQKSRNYLFYINEARCTMSQ